MSYQSGRMGRAEGISLVFFVTVPTAFLTLAGESLETSGELAWFAIIAAGLSTLAMLFLLFFVFNRFTGDLFSVSCQLVGKLGAYLIGVYYAVMFFAIATIWIRQFAENTVTATLPAVDLRLAVGWYALSAAFIIYFGIENIARAAYILLPFIAAGTFLVLGLLEPLYKPNYLFPWQGTGVANALVKGGILVGANAGAFLVAVIADAFQNTKTLKIATLFGLGCSVVLKSISILVFIIVFGQGAGVEKSLPFFEMSRLVSLSRYLQRTESIFIILWVMVGIFGIAISLYMGLYIITKLVNMPTMRPLIPTATLLIAQLALIPYDMNSVLQFERLMVRWYYNIGIYIIPLLLFAATLLKGKRKSKCVPG